MGLVLLSLLLAGTSGAWNGAGPARLSGLSSGLAWTLGASDAELSSLPPQAAGAAREHHVLSLWPPLRGDRHGRAAHLTLLPPPDPAGAIRDPQQLAHRTAGSRSPPLI
ncbi:hypothetical protein GCM10023259_000340 [Thermocatellispora tengchongensis]